MSEINGNLKSVRDRIKAACERSGRDQKSVTLIAVSKLKPIEDIREARESGATDFGENYVQELMDKTEEEPALNWHMIGHLQKNKVKYLIGKTVLIHSVDTVELAERIEKESAKRDVITKILLEVNVACEESKWGFTKKSVKESAANIAKFPHLRVLGLMTSAPITEDPESNRMYFRELNVLAHEMEKENLLAKDPSFSVPVLSMGMTGDFEVAVEEGATMVRVGTAIFGKR